eukprot:jgi/Tetstr1/458085/TSEL_044592.t1
MAEALTVVLDNSEAARDEDGDTGFSRLQAQLEAAATLALSRYPGAEVTLVSSVGRLSERRRGPFATFSNTEVERIRDLRVELYPEPSIGASQSLRQAISRACLRYKASRNFAVWVLTASPEGLSNLSVDAMPHGLVPRGGHLNFAYWDDVNLLQSHTALEELTRGSASQDAASSHW